MLSGISTGSDFHSGSARTTAARVSATVSRPKAEEPVNISKSTHPKAQMSVRLSIGLPRACSGLMYAAVPSITPAIVAPTMVGGLRRIRTGHFGRKVFGKTEVEHLDRAVGRDLDVGGFEIAMDDPRPVGGVQGVGDLLREG